MDAETTRKPRTIRLSLVVIPLVILGLCAWLTIKTLTGGPTYPTFVIPGEAVISLPEPGTYTVFCARPANVTVSMDRFRPPEIVWSVQGWEGTSLNLRPYGGSLVVNNTVAIGTVDIPLAGQYRFRGTLLDQDDREYQISFRKGMLKTVASVVGYVAAGIISVAFLFIYLIICLIRYLARSPSTTPHGM